MPPSAALSSKIGPFGQKAHQPRPGRWQRAPIPADLIYASFKKLRFARFSALIRQRLY
jgi:hypothetical protein